MSEKAVKKRSGAKASEVFDLLEAEYGPLKCFLLHETPFQLLCATILSAQCTDRTVNIATRELFRRFPDAASMASADVCEIERLVHMCGFFRTKAAHLAGAAKAIATKFSSRVPETMDELLTLPGVGRKTANVVLSDAFGKPGLPVDTHVRRVSNLLGLVSSGDPEKIEIELCASLRPEQYGEFSHLLIFHGRSCCVAGRPECGKCVLSEICAHACANNRKNVKR